MRRSVEWKQARNNAAMATLRLKGSTRNERQASPLSFSESHMVTISKGSTVRFIIIFQSPDHNNAKLTVYAGSFLSG